MGAGSAGDLDRSSRIRAEGQGRVEVEDDGPGLPRSGLQDLFRPFHTSKEGGTGLGLAVCRKVVEQQAGTIEAIPHGSLGGARLRVVLAAAD